MRLSLVILKMSGWGSRPSGEADRLVCLALASVDKTNGQLAFGHGKPGFLGVCGLRLVDPMDLVDPVDCVRGYQLYGARFTPIRRYAFRSPGSLGHFRRSSAAVGSSTISSVINPPRNAARKPSTLPRPETTHKACFAF
jgi:hypothetical protein